MKAILSNPFRVIGVPITASDREFASRLSKVELYTDMGKEISYDTDLSIFPPLVRTVNDIHLQCS